MDRDLKDFVYAAKLTRDRASGHYVVSFRDLPEALTSGEDIPDALEEAADCLVAAIASRINDGEDIPTPSAARARERPVAVPSRIAGKAALYLAVRKAGLSHRAMAKRLGVDEKELRRLLDPGHNSKIDRLGAALERLGWRMRVSFEKIAA